jgi:hypothetical protein
MLAWEIASIDNQNDDTGLFTVQVVSGETSRVVYHWRGLSGDDRNTSGTRVTTFPP